MSALAFASAIPEADFGEISLTAAQKTLIRQSFDRLAPASDLVGTLFFLRLFDMDPSLRAQFEGPIKPHARKLMETLKLAILSLNQRHSFKPALRLLGTRFRARGMEPAAYTTMAQAFIWTMEKSLERDFSYSAKRAWTIYLSQMTSVLSAS